MPQGTIEGVTGQRAWNSQQYGDFIDYQLNLSGLGPCYITRKPDSAPPTVGQTIDYEVAKQDQHGTKIKLVQANGAGPQGGGYSQPSGGGDDRQESIEKQVAAKCAADILSGTGELAKFEQIANAVHKWIKGKPLAAQVQQAPTGAPAPDAGPVDTSGFGAPAQQKSDDDIPF